MKNGVRLWLFTLVALCSSRAQVVSTTVCNVAKLPSAFDDKIVRVRATVTSGFEIFAIRDAEGDCGGIWLTYPGGGPVASVSMGKLTPDLQRVPIKLRRDGELKKFQELLDAEMYPRSRGNLCESCHRYEVTATMTGRVDYAGEHGGFGHMNGFPTQFVLESVSEISVKDLSSRYDPNLFSSVRVRFPTAYLQGKVTGPKGEGILSAEVNVHSTEDVPKYVREFTEWTDEKGRFKLEVPPGSYLIGLNLEMPPSPNVPFPPTYFPDTEDSHSATVLRVSDNEHRSDLNIRLKHRLTDKMIRVKVTWPDGKPVVDANVCLKEVKDPTAVVGGSVSHTKEDGTYDLVGFEGIDYVIHGDIYVKPSYKPYCAGNVIVRAKDQVNERVLLRLTKTGEICRDLDYTADGTELSETKPQ